MKIKPTEQPTLLTGITGNKYIVCTKKHSLILICEQIDKSINSIKWSAKHHTYVVRLKNRQHKQKAIQLLDR